MWLAAQPAVHWLSPRMRHVQANWQVCFSFFQSSSPEVFVVSDVCLLFLTWSCAYNGFKRWVPLAPCSGSMFCLAPCSACVSAVCPA